MIDNRYADTVQSHLEKAPVGTTIEMCHNILVLLTLSACILGASLMVFVGSAFLRHRLINAGSSAVVTAACRLSEIPSHAAVGRWSFANKCKPVQAEVFHSYTLKLLAVDAGLKDVQHFQVQGVVSSSSSRCSSSMNRG